jgi:hypothetical protein
MSRSEAAPRAANLQFGIYGLSLATKQYFPRNLQFKTYYHKSSFWTNKKNHPIRRIADGDC